LPSTSQFRGRKVRVATGCGWATDPVYRCYSLMLWDRFLRQPDVDLFLCTTVSPDAERALAFFQMLRVPSGQWNKSVFWITNYNGFAHAVLNRKSIPMAFLTRYPLALALSCHHKLAKPAEPAADERWEISPCPGFDQRFDEFWEGLLHENSGTLLAVRTQETLRWHFKTKSWNDTAWVVGAFQNARLAAYAIFDRWDNHVCDLKRIRLVDFQARLGSTGAVQPILSWMLRECRHTGIHVLEVPGSWLERLGVPNLPAPYYRTLPSWSHYYKATDAGLAEELKNPAAWAPSLFDGDASI